MLRSERGRKIASLLPIDRLLTETDGPFVELQGQPIRPLDVKAAVIDLAEVREIDPEQMRRQILVNLNAVVSGGRKSEDGRAAV